MVYIYECMHAWANNYNYSQQACIVLLFFSAYIDVSTSGCGWITPTLSYNKQMEHSMVLSNLLAHKHLEAKQKLYSKIIIHHASHDMTTA